MGGPHVTLALDDALEMPNADYLVTHEAEVTFPKMLHAIQPGICPRPGLSAARHRIWMPFPLPIAICSWTSGESGATALDSPEVPFVPELPAPFLTIIAGRGCVYNCSFCKPGEDLIFGKGVRRRSVENVIAELKELRDRYGFASFMFHDDCLTEDRRWVADFAERYKEEGFTQPFFCQSRADIIARHPDMVERMADAGLARVFCRL